MPPNNMKNKLILFAVAAGFLASCGTVSITKRYHRGGFQIEFNRNDDDVERQVAGKPRTKKQSEIVSNEVVTPGPKEPYAAIESESEEEPVIEKNQPEAASISVDKQTYQVIPQKGHALKTMMAVKKVSQQYLQPLKKSLKKNTSSPQDAPDGPLMWLLFLVLCIFLPPLAYILIREEADTLFWICLLAWLIFVGWLFNVPGLISFLCWIVSIGIALLALLGS